jgi:myo-inositol-1(or 4)-monophosphatase
LDGFWQREGARTDLAAGLLIASEAGALVEGLRPGQMPLEDGAVLCANNQMFAELAKVIRTTD